MRLILSIAIICFRISFTIAQQTDSMEINQFLEQIVETNKFCGAILIAENDRIIVEGGWGYANREHKVLNSPNTKFDIASMGKMFTAISIMRLGELGKLKLDDKVGDLLPDFPNEQIKQNATVHHLLSHTGGLGDYFNSKYENRPGHKLISLNDYLTLFHDDDLKFEPGSAFGYSNAGYVVLGLIIEKLSGMSYYDFVEKHIFLELGMKDTGWNTNEVVDNLAENYEFDGTDWRKTFISGARGSSAGGCYSTVGDLYKFVKGLKDYSLLNSSSWELMIKDHSPQDHGYGYGIKLTSLNGQQLIGHSGGAPGISGEVDIYLKTGMVVISLSNQSARQGWEAVRFELRKRVAGENDESTVYFNTKEVLKIYESNGLDAAIERLDKIKSKVKDRNIFEYGQKYRKKGNLVKAIEVMQILVHAFPDFWFANSILADVYLENGNTNQAKLYYQKSLELNPENQVALDRLAELESKND